MLQKFQSIIKSIGKRTSIKLNNEKVLKIKLYTQNTGEVETKKKSNSNVQIDELENLMLLYVLLIALRYLKGMVTFVISVEN